MDKDVKIAQYSNEVQGEVLAHIHYVISISNQIICVKVEKTKKNLLQFIELQSIALILVSYDSTTEFQFLLPHGTKKSVSPLLPLALASSKLFSHLKLWKINHLYRVQDLSFYVCFFSLNVDNQFHFYCQIPHDLIHFYD